MRRDVVTTIGGLVLVGLVVIAAFLYGNHQRNDQVRRDQDATRQQQEAKASPSKSTASSQQKTTQSGSSNAAGPATTSGDSAQQPAVQKPNQNDGKQVQGTGSNTGGKVVTSGSGQTSAAGSSSSAATSQPVASTTPQTGGHPPVETQPTTTPKTGGQVLWILGAIATAYALREYRRSRLGVIRAQRF
jgi:FtsZ-interacting cell division protein ZipA